MILQGRMQYEIWFWELKWAMWSTCPMSQHLEVTDDIWINEAEGQGRTKLRIQFTSMEFKNMKKWNQIMENKTIMEQWMTFKVLMFQVMYIPQGETKLQSCGRWLLFRLEDS